MRSYQPFIMILLLQALILQAQAQSRISGSVRSKQGPVPGASISIKGTVNGATADSSGAFNFITEAKGDQVLVVTCVGFKDLEKPIHITDSLLKFDLVLQQDEKLLDPVVITAGSFIASDKAKGASLSPVDVVTTAGNNGDIANALRALPGTQQIGDQEGLFVRGGTNDETKQFIDGTLFRNPNFSAVPGILQPARVSPFLFNGIVFSSGGYSALYGEAMSGALILESVDLPEKSSAIVGISPIVGVAGFQQLDRKKRYSFGINTRYVDYNLYSKIIKQQPDYFHGPEYFSADANFRVRTGKRGMLKYYIVGGYNNIGLRRPDIDSPALKSGFQLEGGNIYHNLSYRNSFNNGWKIDIGTTYTHNQDRISNQLLDTLNRNLFLPGYPYSTKNRLSVIRSDFIEGKLVLTKQLGGGHLLRFGGGDMYSKDRYSYRTATAATDTDTSSMLADHLLAAFAETDLRFSTNMAAKLGARYEYSSLLQRSALAPRISIGFRLPGRGGQFNAAYGIFYQKPENIYLHQGRDMDFSHAVHYMLNYMHSANNRTFRIEAYYKQYNTLVKFAADSNYTNNGSGYAKGIEFFWRDKKTFRNLDYWITYTYIDTKRDYLNYPSLLSPNFATPHTVSVVAKRFFEKLNTNINLAYTFATGRPYYYIINDRQGNPVLADQGKTSDYNSLNLSISYLCSLFKHWKNKDFTILFFGMNNVTGAGQVFGYNYSSNGQYKLPVTLPAPRSMFIGIFINLGIDRRLQNLEDNL